MDSLGGRQESSGLIQALWLAAILLLPGLPAEAAPEEKAPSHFVDVWEPAAALPAGANLSVVRPLLRKRIALHSDFPASDPPAQHIDTTFAAQRLEPGRPVLARHTSPLPPPAIARYVPPRQEAATLLVSREQVKAVSLCGPYDALELELEAQSEWEGGTKTKEAHLLAFQENEEPAKSVLVLSVPKDMAAAVKQAGRVQVRCLREEKYE